MKLQNLIEMGRSVGVTIISNNSKDMGDNAELQPGLLPSSGCDQNATKMDNLANHKQAGNKLFTCDVCSYSTRRNRELLVHKKAKHEGFRYSCPLCGHKTVFRHSLKRHMDVQHEDKRYTCDTCAFTSSNSYELKLHSQSTRERSIFVQNVTIKQHKRDF